MRLQHTLLFGGFAVQQAVATFEDWNQAPGFTCPQNTDNRCSDQQKGGWNWDDLQLGSFSSYQSYSFDGFQCDDSNSKRDLILARGDSGPFAGKSISGKASKSGGPSFNCAEGDNFSVDQYFISSERDVDVEFHYSMPDGSNCMHTSSCKSAGNAIKNTQCGGATGVTFKLPPHESSDCGFNIHGINWDCNPPQKPPPKASSSAVEKPTESSRPYTRSSARPTYSRSSAPYSSSTSAVSYSSSVVPSPTYSSPPSSYRPRSSRTRSSQPSSVYGGSPSQPTNPTECPDVVPQCLNTWMFVTTCKDNSDHDCFCRDQTLITEVYECISSWGNGDIEIQWGITYIVGICAQYIPQNPWIIGSCPSSISIAPPAQPTITGAAQVPYSTVTVHETVTVPVTYVTGTAAGQPIPSSITVSVLSSVYTVPQVSFVTGQGTPGGPSGGVALIPAPSGVAAGNAPASTYSVGTKGNGTVTASNVPAQFTGNAASKIGGSSLLGGSIFALFAMIFSF